MYLSHKQKWYDHDRQTPEKICSHKDLLLRFLFKNKFLDFLIFFSASIHKNDMITKLNCTFQKKVN